MKTSILLRIFILIACSFLLFGCLSVKPKSISSSTTVPSFLTPFSTQDRSAVATLDISCPVSSHTLAPETAYPGPTFSSVIATAYPTNIPTLIPVISTSSFSDCDRTPGLFGCDASAPRLAGHIAIYDIAENRLVGLDLQSGQGWSISMSQPKNLEWSPDGSQLLVRMDYPIDQRNEVEYLLLDKGGKLLQPITRDKYLYWQPQGASLRTYEQRKVIHSKDGAEVWLENSKDGKTLHFRSSENTEWQEVGLQPTPMEWPIELYGWIPGTSKIVLAQYPLSVANDDMMGNYFFTFDIQTGELHFLKDFHGHLDPQFISLRGSDLAIIHLTWGLADDTLAILDGKTGNITYPLPRETGHIQPYSLRQIAWQPGKNNDNGLLAMMANRLQTNPPNPLLEKPLFSKDGIYLYSPKSGQKKLLRETPGNTLGGNFYWTTDGQYLLYSLGPINSSQNAQTSLYIRQILTDKEWLLLDHLANPTLKISYISWPLIAVSIE